MGFLKRLFGWEKSKRIDLNEQELIDIGACPNCWGIQEYDGKYRNFGNDRTKANINNDKFHQKAFVAQFVETHVTGIRLERDGSHLTCPSCRGKFKEKSKRTA